MNDLYRFDQRLRRKYSCRHLAGVDEAGRGPLAGPLVAAAVILPADFTLEEINDSKKLTPRRRECLYDIIRKHSLAYAASAVRPSTIDSINIFNAAYLAMYRAVNRLSVKPGAVLVDGPFEVKKLRCAQEAVVKGDSRSMCVAAASIMAKVTRDRYMDSQDRKYPHYGFIDHKGYPTRKHYAAIRKHGVTPLHRRSFNLKDAE